MKQFIRNIALLFTLLLLGGVVNEAWAKKVTYHILTLPFTVRNYNNTGDYRANIRVEALQCTSDKATVGLPDQFISPLATGFRYWKTATPTYDKLYDSGHSTKIITTKYYLYQCSAGKPYECLSGEILNPEATSTDDCPNDIYVTYEYNRSQNILKLDGITKYNVAITSGGKQKYLCYNRSRNNRIANANAGAISGEHLASDEFVIPEEGQADNQLSFNYGKWGPIGVFLGFIFTGQDPYNFTIMTSYSGRELHITDAITNVDNTGTIKPYAGSSLMSKIGNNSMWFDCSNDKHYKLQSGIKEAGKWTDEKYAECKTTFYNTSEEARYDTWVGFYRYESPTLNTYALLPNLNGDKVGYIFVGSKMNQGDGNSKTPTIYQPNSSGNYFTYYDNYDNNESGAKGKRRSQPYFKLQAFSSALPTQFYEIKTYTLHVKTHGSKTTLTKEIKWSDAKASEKIVDHVPDDLKRKYVTFTKAYTSDNPASRTEISTFADAKAAGCSEIWLDYEIASSLPFEVLPEGGSYEDARWYTLRVNGKEEQKNIAYNFSNDFITGSSSIGSESDLHQGENSANAMVAFMGDPFELKIISRAASEAASANRYIGCNTGASDNTSLNTNKTGVSDISTWEIVYESTDVGNFVLRQFNTVAAPKYIGWSSSDNKPVTYSTTSTRIRVVEMDKKKYAFHIMRSDHSIAVMATTSLDVGKALKNYNDIPKIIRSPYLKDATVYFYDTQAKAETNDPAVKTTNAPYDADDLVDGVYANVYVRYTTSTRNSDYNVKLNGEYIYTDSENDQVYSKGSISGSEAALPAYQWTLDYTDPYAMTIWNKGKNKYVKIAAPDDNTALEWDSNSSNATPFIVKQSGDNEVVFEVMYATGDGVDASKTYYNIGRNTSSTTENTVYLYKNTTYRTGFSQLQFELTGTTATDVIYHLIDKNNVDLLQVTTRHTDTDPASFPPQYRSPLVKKYHYFTSKENAIAGTGEIVKVGTNGNIYVTYEVNDLVNLKRGKLYLLKYQDGQMFNEEDGSDGISKTPQQAIYPYCNGDCNFFVYGQNQYDLQQQGAASTRTRWAWYVQSDIGDKGDPYHVKIMSRQSETYPSTNGTEHNAYFSTFKPTDYTKVITTLAWPGISDDPVTEYMVLGNEGQYQLVTTNEISGSRYVVNSFEQYWKTFDTIRKKVYGESSAKEDEDDPTTVPADAKAHYGSSDPGLLRDYLENTLEWHHYEKWAYAKRWNGYNNGSTSDEGKPEKKKGWEKIEHWYQTVNMGEGYFDFVETSIDPVLILLDQHGWEIMRKPLPSGPDDPKKDAKYEAIRPYNSPMVKEYAFWATTKKRTGLHQYYLLSDRIGGDNFTSTDLTNLPPYGSKNVLDKKGNLNDQYVTYIVKEEYAQTYNPKTKTGKEFLIEQGSKYASTSDGETITINDVSSVGSMQKHLTDDVISDGEKWYVKPNWNIDIEMGYKDVSLAWTKKKADGSWDSKNPNAYEHYKYKDVLTAQYISDKDSLGYFSFSNGFDPYNIQIMPKSHSADPSRKFIKTNATGAKLEDGIMHGVYTGDPAVSLGDSIPVVTPENSIWFDSRKLSITNTTWMAVQDAHGNMQLMPRFDPDRRMSEFGELIAPTSADAAKTYTKLYRSAVYDYRIIDNSGRESLRYKSGGDLVAQTPERFQSPLATNFTYYTDAECTNEITGALDGVKLTDNKVYIRYEYNEEADDQKILMGNWQTMKLNNRDVQYTIVSSTNGIYYDEATSETKPSPVDGDDKKWQWKFLETPQSKPDPYAVKIYNRNKADGDVMNTTYALLPFISGGSSDGYTLTCMKAASGYTYRSLTGKDATNKAAANDDANSSNIYDGTDYNIKCKILLTDDVEHTFNYKVYTNSGVFAISATQDNETVKSSGYVPTLPNNIKSPLLKTDQFRYYDKGNFTFDGNNNIATADTTDMALNNLYGLNDDEVVVRYIPYNPLVTEYMVPNVRNTPGGIVAKGIGSNDAPLDLSETMIYNVIWYNDNMMTTTDNTDVVGHANQDIQTDSKHEWKIGGNDPYAITLYNKSAEGYLTAASADDAAACTLTSTATTFMLLPKDGSEYGMLAITGHEGSKLTITDDGNTGTKESAKITTSNPANFIIFALATHQVIYHLMIKNIGDKTGIVIPYRGTETGNVVQDYRIKWGTTQRDLKSRDTTGGEEGHIDGDLYQLGESLKAIGERSGNTEGLFARDSIYCYDDGHISLGDVLEVPSAFYRPNVVYDFFVEGVYSSDGKSEIPAMNEIYKGKNLKEGHDQPQMGDNSGLLGTTVFINIVYSFNGALDTNSGNDFVTNVTQNKWYTVETSDATPKLAQFTNAWGMRLLEGRESHYTNDYLWTPVGDPYGFKFYNRYIYKTDAVTNKVLTTASIANNATFVMDAPENNDNRDVYELLSATTTGYFQIRPMKKSDSGLSLYFYNDNGEIKLNTKSSEFNFGLSEEMLKPYYDRAGYVGGLTPEGKVAYDNAKPDLMAMQEVVYNDDNIVPYTSGYYRLHSPISATSIKEERYASGYTHAIERDQDKDGNEDDAIPLHFYERKSAGSRQYEELGSGKYTISDATRGELPVPQVENDPASIFHFSYERANATGHPIAKLSTQGLNVKQNKMTTGAGGEYCVMDIGGAVFLIHNDALPASRMYFNYDQRSNIYDLKFSHDIPTDDARWCLQPVQKTVPAGNNEMGLRLTTNNGGDSHYYATFYAPFDVLLTDAEKDEAYVVPTGGWNTSLLHPKKIGEYNTEANSCPEDYRGSNQFVPAGTPVIIRTTSTSGYVTLALPTTSPSTSVPCVFTGQCLEQMLPHGADYVYTFGRPSKGSFTEDVNFSTNGEMEATANAPGKGLGFYKNANPNKEKSEYSASWTLNNKYVYANKIYYREEPSPSRELSMRGIEFVPVIFDNEEEGGEQPNEEEQNLSEGATFQGDGCIYDLMGRKVATRQQVEDGSWRLLRPGIYILNGKKFRH